LNKLCDDRIKILHAQPMLELYDVFIDQIDMSHLRPVFDLTELQKRGEGDVLKEMAEMLLDLEKTDHSARVLSLLEGLEIQVRPLRQKLQEYKALASRGGIAAEDFPPLEELLQTESRRLLSVLLQQEEARNE
jgi:hypothetical protein